MLEKNYKIQIFNPKTTFEDFAKFYDHMGANPELQSAVDQATKEYLSWEEFRRKSWSTVDPEGVWKFLTYLRLAKSRKTSVRDKSGANYTFDPERHLRFQHEVDLELGGNLVGISNFGETDKRQIIRRNLIEESIASSKLEGANTSRETARHMLAEGRKPRDKSERMIVNNHAAMNWIEEHGKNQKLSIDMLLELHTKVIEGTLADNSHEGRLRNTFNTSGKRLVIKPWDDETIAYVTPDREFVDAELPRLISFANDDDGSSFIHPLVKAIMLHFWIGLLHPFEDGNGRLARILFYWYMLRNGYWAFSYLSLSEIITKSPKQYAMAFIYSEQDKFDLNYFIQYNIKKLQLARQRLQKHLQEKITENKQRLRIISSGKNLNVRQVQLLQYLNQDEISYTSVAEHHKLNPEVSYLSAIGDLKSLVQNGYLRKQKNGRNVIYLPTDKLQLLFK